MVVPGDVEITSAITRGKSSRRALTNRRSEFQQAPFSRIGRNSWDHFIAVSTCSNSLRFTLGGEN